MSDFSRRNIMSGFGAAAAFAVVPRIAKATLGVNVHYDIVPTVNRPSQAITWSGVNSWGDQRNPNAQSIAYVGQGITGFTCHTRVMKFPQSPVQSAIIRFVFDSYNGVQGSIRLTSFYYDASNVPHWKNDWHAPFTSNRPYHPDNQGSDITAAFNAFMAGPPVDFAHDLQFTCDVIGYGQLYAARLELLI